MSLSEALGFETTKVFDRSDNKHPLFRDRGKLGHDRSHEAAVGQCNIEDTVHELPRPNYNTHRAPKQIQCNHLAEM